MARSKKPQPLVIELPYWFDAHAHFRQAERLKDYLMAHVSMFCAAVVAMPNTLPPVCTSEGYEGGPKGWSVEYYRHKLEEAGSARFDTVIIPIYLTAGMTPALVRHLAALGYKYFKAYPPHGTTNSDAAAPLELYMENGVLAAIQEVGGYLLVHGEESGISNQDNFDQHRNAEILFYKRVMPRVRKAFPTLRIICEHITTRVAVEFVRKGGKFTAATICPQHLLYTIGDLAVLMATHLNCKPLVKFEADRKALRRAVTNINNRQFFAGTDSAPHPEHDKHTPCDCAAGCFTAGYAPQLYVSAFEAAGLDMSTNKNQNIFRRFMVENGSAFYGLPISTSRFRLVKKRQRVIPLVTSDGKRVIPLPLGMNYKRGKRRFMPTYLDWSIEHAA